MDAINVEDVSKTFKLKGKKVGALKDVSLRIKKGEIFGLLGPNGAGKTTLLNILIKLLSPDSGRVEILGEDIRKNNRILEQVNFVSGESKFHWVLTAEDILYFYGKSYNLKPDVMEKRIERMIDFFGIKGVRKRKFVQLSTGERMRLRLAKAMLNHPTILLMDEPTLGLDPSIAIKVRDEIKRVNKKFGTTVLLTSHYMNEVEELADRIAFIHEGEIVDMGTVEKIKRKRFDWYDVEIKVKKVMDKSFLKKNGFQVKGRTLKKRLRTKENLSEVLSLMHKKGYKVLDVEARRPSLEDYFIKILGAKNEKL